MTRQNMIDELTHYEIQWVIDNPEAINEAVEFFSKGGFNNWTDESLTVHHERTFVSENEQ